MDIDEFLTVNAGSWSRLAELNGRAGRNVRRLDASELEELLRLYLRTSAHLSQATTTYRDPGLQARLSQLVAQAGAIIYGTRPRTLRALGSFFSETLPAALWHVRRFLLVSALLTLLPALGFGLWLSNSSKAVDATAPAAIRQAYIDHDFTAYYRSQPSAEFAAQVYTNNVTVSMEAFAGGIMLCLPTALILVNNGASLGEAGGLFSAAGQSAKFWGSVTPHGLIELTSVIIAGAAGLRLGWALIDPGDRRRRLALAEESRRAVVLLFGVFLTLAIAGTIEGFVTGSSLPTTLRVGIGVAVELSFLTYMVVCGRAAAARGLTGAAGERSRGWITGARNGAARGTVIGDTVVGDTVVGDTVIGDTVIGDTVIGTRSPSQLSP